MAEATQSKSQQPSCAGIRRDGQRCEALGLLDGYCYSHSPANATARDAARRKGGRNRSNRRRLRGLMPPRLVPVFDQLEGALSDVLAGGLDPKQATAAAAVARAMVSVLTAGELEERLRKLEEGQGQGQGHQ